MGTHDGGLIRSLARSNDRQEPYGVAIILPTLLRPALTRAVQSVYAQDFGERIQILIGIDKVEGDCTQLDRLVFDRLRRGHKGRSTGGAASFYTINPADIVHLSRLQYFRQKGAELASDRRLGVTRLARLIEAWRPMPPSATPGGSFKAENPILAELLRKLKPQEILVLGAGDGAIAMALGRTARAIGLACLVLATGAPSESDEENLRKRIAAAGLEETVTALPTRYGKDTAYLGEHRVLVDLVQLGPGAGGAAPWRDAWPLLREGGFLIGRGKPDKNLEKFVVDTGSTMIQAEFPGAGARWIVEKGLGTAS
jgi:hypothetical protein